MHIDPLPPLSLYVHLPWCVRKCPYCDFNSHMARGTVPEARYVDALLSDLAVDAALVAPRLVQTIFFGGGTPSLFHAESIARLLTGIRERVALADDAEITLEANPGTVDLDRFRDFRQAGINRLSIGIQSFDDNKLQALGRIHGRTEALAAADAARTAGFENFNLDLMYGLPGQDAEQALTDIMTAIAPQPTHLSVYELTIEPNTQFYRAPPPLPDEQAIDAIHETVAKTLTAHGYDQYEVSAYARTGYECRHNRNYWEFGDYLGIGAGAHSKISCSDGAMRVAKARHPDAYLRDAGAGTVRTEERRLTRDDLVGEFMLNALRLHGGVSVELFAARTGLSIDRIERPRLTAQKKGLLTEDSANLRPTELGRRFLNDLISLFLPERRKT
jgi:putative oxygen-independent coproporphyrinogen III oxidase